MNGISVMGVVISYCIIGLFFIYKSKKTDAKLLFYLGLAGICNGLIYSAAYVDFLTILLTGNNLDKTSLIIFIVLANMWAPPLQILILYVSFELIVPKKKWHLISIYLVLGAVYELFLLLDPMGSAILIYPDSPGEDLIDVQVIFGSPLFIISIIMLFSILIFCGFGFIYKSIKTTGIIRKKFLILSIGIIYVTIFAILENYISQSIILIISRFGVVSGLIFFYFGLREEPEKKEKFKPEKKIKVEGDLFRISQYKKRDISEVDVSISKERKICLVCKGKVGGIMFMCPNCETFYCLKCSQALSNLENACWACEEAIDKSKPVKLFKKEEEIQVETSEKPQKKPKTKK